MESTVNTKNNRLTKLTFGCSRLGKAAFEDTTSKSELILNKAWDLGIRSFDTASNYTYGDSEEILGNFIKGKEEEILICTKGGTMLTKNASYLSVFRPFFKLLRPIIKRNKAIKRKSPKRKKFDIDYLSETCDMSVKRMGENIYAYQIHNPTIEVLKDRSYIDFFKEIKSKYKISHCGLALTSLQDMDSCTYIDDIDIIQFPMNYYSFEAEDEARLKDLRKRGVLLVGRMPFHRGLLTDKEEITTGGKMGIKDDNFGKKKKEICQKYKINEVQLALWFLKDMGLLDSILFSSFNIKHLEENVNVFNAEIPPNFSWREIVKDLES
jgi:aryl-alcohol dehydrogenase-like predicted oxidoreductase